MSLELEPIKPEFVAVVHGLDLREPLSDPTVELLRQAIARYAVLVFHDQRLDDTTQLAFSKRLGPIQPAVGNNVTPQAERRLAADFSDVSNLAGSSRIFQREDRARLFGFGNQLWHSDASYRAIPAKYSILSARTVPDSGGNTEFADMRAAWEALDQATRAQLEGLVAEHSLMHSRSLLGFTTFSDSEQEVFAPVRHRMVRSVPEHARKSLYLSAHAGAIVGWPVPEARMFIFDLMEQATRPELVYAHEWRLHDLIIWDNRQTMHRVRPFDDLNVVRDMRRTTIMGDGPTVEQV
ncbi:MAG: TauD/TfdA family dioxygenase [Gammaproteobacteria bacterium]|nr:TauD/TfdA family dioxygenase [Gammaproteobacteria bacterium]